MDKFATIYGSPGTRVRFSGFFKLFCPFIIIVFILGLYLGNLLPKPNISEIAKLLISLLLIILGWLMFDTSAKRFSSFLIGARGEEIVGRELAMLSNSWHIFHSIPLKGIEASITGKDIDHIIIGPAGIVIVETKNWNGNITIEAGHLNINSVKPTRSPIEQIRNEAISLANILANDAPQNIPLYKVVCFASNNLEDEKEFIDDVLICNARVLRDYINSLPHAKNLSTNQYKLTLEKLALMCECSDIQ